MLSVVPYFVHAEIIILPQLLLISKSDWLKLPLSIRVHNTLLGSMCRAMPFSARPLKTEKQRGECLDIIRGFKIHYGELLLRLLRPWGTRLTTPFPPQTSNRLRFRCTATGCLASTCQFKKWIRSTLFYFHMAKVWSTSMISFSCVDLTSPIFFRAHDFSFL